ncbi:hypothetical protein HYZ98_01515 [Candidatus Peregrinibacteria bacterium]|nr:hypothetical protein [Candidatus Peregrinibacteria bacterium]
MVDYRTVPLTILIVAGLAFGLQNVIHAATGVDPNHAAGFRPSGPSLRNDLQRGRISPELQPDVDGRASVRIENIRAIQRLNMESMRPSAEPEYNYDIYALTRRCYEAGVSGARLAQCLGEARKGKMYPLEGGLGHDVLP